MIKSIKLAVFFLLFFVLSTFLAFFLKNDFSKYSRLVMQDFYEQKNIDYLFCGASHVSHGIIPEILSKKLNKNVFCAGTSAQELSGTYYIIKEAINRYKLKCIFVDLDFEMAVGENINFFNKEPGKNIYIISSYLKNPIIKTEYLLTATSPKYYLNSFFPLGIYKDIEPNPQTIATNIKTKIFTKDYYNYKYNETDFLYLRGGAIIKNEAIKNRAFYDFEENISKIQDINKEWLYYLNKIISICKKNNIKLVFYSAPIPDFFLNTSGNYDFYYSFVNDYLKENGYDFFDFNLCRQKYLKLEDCDFYDNNHLNNNGMRKFTDVFFQFITKAKTQNEMFFSTYKEKLEIQQPCIYGILLKKLDGNTINIVPVMNFNNFQQVKFNIYRIDNENDEILYKFSDGNKIIIPQDSKSIRIVSIYNSATQTDCIIKL